MSSSMIGNSVRHTDLRFTLIEGMIAARARQYIGPKGTHSATSVIYTSYTLICRYSRELLEWCNRCFSSPVYEGGLLLETRQWLADLSSLVQLHSWSEKSCTYDSIWPDVLSSVRLQRDRSRWFSSCVYGYICTSCAHIDFLNWLCSK